MVAVLQVPTQKNAFRKKRWRAAREMGSETAHTLLALSRPSPGWPARSAAVAACGSTRRPACIAQLRAALRQRAPGDNCASWGVALWAAAAKGLDEHVEALLRAGVPPDAGLPGQLQHGTPLVAACSTRSLGCAQQLLRAGADPNACGGQPLLRAATGGDALLVKLLLDSGAARWALPLVRAVRLGHASVVALF